MSEAEAPAARPELAVIARRIRYVYLALLFAVVSGLFICLPIAGAFVGAFVPTDLSTTTARDLPGGLDPAPGPAVR